ncbi:hypothetical protein [Alteribacillus bidgolensis]|uniref:Uncharacterized protein n=1 Tax=Alteribacillus bidgolensis TaxID=930129 RepID=A0A1G8I8Z4_9BACI|nr:hypothetical protein [Alteribacillus bidgolensis]SDI15366.1 hypothetical protein SAMN05216352_10590 [Alteribacillus bidgolensis]
MQYGGFLKDWIYNVVKFNVASSTFDLYEYQMKKTTLLFRLHLINTHTPPSLQQKAADKLEGLLSGKETANEIANGRSHTKEKWNI